MTTRQPLSPGGSTFAVLDTNVLLPPRLSDFLFDLFLLDLYYPRWTADIAEYLRNFRAVVLSASSATATLSNTTPTPSDHTIRAEARLQCFRSAVGAQYQVLLYQCERYLNMVPAKVHPSDRHVASAALVLQTLALEETSANRVFLISNNLRHLAVRQMEKLGIRVVTPGEFIDALSSLAPTEVELALYKTISDLIAPGFTRRDALNLLLRYGAQLTARHLARKWRLPLP